MPPNSYYFHSSSPTFPPCFCFQDERLSQATLDRFRLPGKTKAAGLASTGSTGLGLTAASLPSQLDSTAEQSCEEATATATLSPAFSAAEKVGFFVVFFFTSQGVFYIFCSLF